MMGAEGGGHGGYRMPIQVWKPRHDRESSAHEWAALWYAAVWCGVIVAGTELCKIAVQVNTLWGYFPPMDPLPRPFQDGQGIRVRLSDI